MGSGNYTFGMKPTYLTKASCAVMDVCELRATQAHAAPRREGSATHPAQRRRRIILFWEQTQILVD